MIIYSYTPERGDKVSRALIGSLAGAGLTFAILAELLASLSSVFHATAFGLLLGSILVWSRCMLSFTYSIESSEDGRPPDLVIRENRGKTSRILSRASVKGGKLIRPSGFKPNGAPVFDNRPTVFIKDHWIFAVSESDGEGFIRFCPDEKMLELMHELGCEAEG